LTVGFLAPRVCYSRIGGGRISRPYSEWDTDQHGLERIFSSSGQSPIVWRGLRESVVEILEAQWIRKGAKVAKVPQSIAI